MSKSPREWTDADAASLPPTHDIVHDTDNCKRCGKDRGKDLGPYCEACHKKIERRGLYR